MMTYLTHFSFHRRFTFALLVLMTSTLHLGAQRQLTLQEALDQAQNNLAYQARLEQIQVLEAKLQQAGRRPNPHLEAEFETGAVSGDSEDYLLSLLVNQTWERGGKRQLRRQIAQAQLDQTVLDAEDYLRVLTSEIRLAFLELLRFQKQISLLETHSERIDNLLQLDLVRVEQGEIPTLNTEQLQAELTVLAAQKGQFETQRWRTQYQFNVLIGSAAETEYVAVEEETQERMLPTIDRAMSFALENRPDLRKMRAAVTQADLEVEMEQAVAKRDWDLGAGYHRISDSLDANDFVPPSILHAASTTNLLHVTLTIPLPLWDDNSGNVAAAVATKKVKESELALAESLVKSEVLSAYQDHRLNQRNLELYQKTLVPRLQNNWQRLEAAYQLTGEALGDWIGIQQDFLDAALQALGADFQVRQSVIKLEQAVGGSLEKVTQGSPS
ncbi:TolC family protein [Acidobacteria bacterium AH-259-D05]|nr:TolC family protein [Acidobacteria bacterium AH-259-D05]